MLKKALSIAAIVAGAALSAVGIVTVVRHDDDANTDVAANEAVVTTTEEE